MSTVTIQVTDPKGLGYRGKRWPKDEQIPDVPENEAKLFCNTLKKAKLVEAKKADSSSK